LNYVAIDTSSKNLIIVVCKDGEIYSHFDSNCGVKHSDKIMVELERLIIETNFNLKKADFIACVTGAGSFTGIRIGVSTVKALCFANNLPFIEVTAFDTIAYNKKDERVLALIDAGHGGFYACGYDKGKIDLEPCYIMLDEVLKLKDYKLLSFSEVKSLETIVVSPLAGLIEAINDKKDKKEYSLDKLVPLYVRKSQAEEGRL
jgi:tRNA threonylcarbamoyladenosine biosynthesis protein TsaB